MANQNGMAAQNAAMYGGMNAQQTTPAGLHSDMLMLNSGMDNLTSVLHENREEWAQIEELLARASRLQGRGSSDGPTQLTNGAHSAQSEDPDADRPTPEQLQIQLGEAKTQITQMTAEHSEIIRMYESTLESVRALVRENALRRSVYIVGKIKEHYFELGEARQETMEAQLEHQAWQARLQRVSDGVRTAMKAREEEGMPWKRRIAALKQENRFLRAKVGWDPPADSEEEEGENEDVGHGPAVEESRGRHHPQAEQVTVAVQEVPP